MASLVIRPEKLGDLVVATPVFQALRESFPGEPVHLLTDEVCGSIVENDPHLDRIIRVPWKGRYTGERLRLASLYSTLAANGPYRRAVVLYTNWEPWNWLLGLQGVRDVAQIGGTVSALLWRHRRRLRRGYASAEHMSEMFLQVAAMVGASTTEHNPRLYVTNEERAAALAKFPSLIGPDKIFIHAFSLTSNANLRPADYFNLSRYLAEQTSHRVYLLGTEAELAQSGYMPHPGVSTELVGRMNLRELLAVCSHAQLVIGGSSGIVHISAALGVPTLGLYCPAGNHHLVWGPRGPWTRVLTAPPPQCRRLGATTGGCQAPGLGPEGFCNLAFAMPPKLIWQEARALLAERAAAF